MWALQGGVFLLSVMYPNWCMKIWTLQMFKPKCKKCWHSFIGNNNSKSNSGGCKIDVTVLNVTAVLSNIMTESTHCFQKRDSNSGCRCAYDSLLKILSRLLCTDLYPPSGADEVCGHGSSKIYTHHQELMKFEGSLKSLLFITKVMVTTLWMIGAQFCGHLMEQQSPNS